MSYTRFVVLEGGKKKAVAEDIGIPIRTLFDWESNEKEDALRPRRRGRPPRRSTREERNRMLDLLELLGPQTGLETLKWLCPELARGEIEDILWRYRAHWLREQSLEVSELDWHLAGRVWAVDYTEPPEPVDQKCEAVLSARDLSSGAQILWEGQVGPRGELTRGALERLFCELGAPLVLKLDNGPAFICEAVREVCAKRGVKLLFSPRWTPRYNGSCESGIRWMKLRTENQAWLGGRPGSWLAEDLLVAQRLTNSLPKRPGKGAISRGEVFHAREPITEDMRLAFTVTVGEEEARERAERGIARARVLSRVKQAEIDRKAMRRALVAHGILNVRKRRVSLTLKSIFRAKIS